MVESVPFGVASAREMHTRECVQPRKCAGASEFSRVARLLWPIKTAITLADLVGANHRTAERWVSGEVDPPYPVIEATMHAIFSRK